MNLASPFQMGRQGRFNSLGQHRRPILPSFAIAHLNLVACKIDIFDTQPQALEKPHSGAEKKGRHQLVGPTHHTQDALDLLFAQDQRPALWLFRSCNIGKLPELFLQHFVVKKDQGVEGLLLRTGGNPFIHGKVG